MRTNIDLNEKLVAEAMRYADVRTKKDLVHLALREFIARHRRMDIRELRDTVGIREDYDYKSLRIEEGRDVPG
ncbi:MAG: type II toxin-antitoxin system VapB family antitoxin [bacterium]|nr:type II toxin-antitoxin system VapB family antitoxin [bacterium]